MGVAGTTMLSLRYMTSVRESKFLRDAEIILDVRRGSVQPQIHTCV